MKYSENSHYQQYMRQYAAGNLPLAKEALIRCSEDFEAAGSPAQRADLVQRIAIVEYEMGDVTSALQRFQHSEAMDPTSLLPRLQFARFLAEKAKNCPAAREKCDEVIHRATEDPFPESEEDFGSDDYIQMATELRESLLKSAG